MVELRIDLEPYDGKGASLVEAFQTHFVPAISVQKGFKSVSLLKRHDSLRAHQISLRFESEELREKWVASDEHQAAFLRIAELCSSVTWRNHDVVSSVDQ